MDVSNACVFIDNQPYRVKSYQRGVTDDLVSRFGSSEQGQTNLDLLKAITQKSFRGGGFQRRFTDQEMTQSIVNGYFNQLDQSLYFTPAFQRYTSTSMSMSTEGVTAWCFYKNSLFLASRTESPGVGNKMIKFDISTQAIIPVTLPSDVANSATAITSMVTHKGAIFFAGHTAQVSGDMPTYRFDGGATFVRTVGAIRKLISWRGVLYGINAGADFFQINKEMDSPDYASTATLIKAVGAGSPNGQADTVQNILLYNNALYIAKTDGLFRYDGVDVLPSVDLADNMSYTNFLCSDVFNGRMYYSIASKVFEFDGTNIRLLQDFTDGYQIRAITGSPDRLCISAQVKSGSPSIYPGKDSEIPAESFAQHLFVYNGVGLFDYCALPAGQADYFRYVNVKPIIVGNQLYIVYPDGYVNNAGEPRSSGFVYSHIELADEFTIRDLGGLTGTRSAIMTVVSSDIDCGYASVDKSLNGIFCDYDGFISGESYFTVEIQTFSAGAWSDWKMFYDTRHIAAGVMPRDYSLHEQSHSTTNIDSTPPVGTKFRYRLIAKIDSAAALTFVPRISSLTLRYTIQPRQRRQWLLTLTLDGVDNKGLMTPDLAPGVREDRSTSFLRRIIYDAHKNKLPVLFYDIDYTKVLTTTPLRFKSTDFISAGDTVAFSTAEEEWANRRIKTALYDEVAGRTEIELATFGYRVGIHGNDDPTISAGARVRKSHAVYVKTIENDRYIINENTINDGGGNSDAYSDIVIRLVEV